MITNKRIFKTLIVEDHPIVIEGYSNLLCATDTFILNVSSALNCDEAINQLKQPKDLVILDLQIPPSKDKKFLSGEDIGLWLRDRYPKTKILIITFISDAKRIRSILKNIRPEGFIIKSDMTSANLITATGTILNGKTYYSRTVKKLIDNNNINGYFLDDIDRKILYHLSNGETNKTIAKLVYLSIRGFEDRKAKLKDVFGITKDSDTNLIKETKRRNYI